MVLNIQGHQVTASNFTKLFIARTCIPEEKLIHLLKIDDVQQFSKLVASANEKLSNLNGKIYKVNSELNNSVIYTLVYHGRYMRVDQPANVTNFFKVIINKLVSTIRSFHESNLGNSCSHDNFECKINEHDSLREFKGPPSQGEAIIAKLVVNGYLESKAGSIYLGPTSKFGLGSVIQPYLKTSSINGERLIYYKFCCGNYYHPHQVCAYCSI
eukprot:NODE_279_length_11907_cov_0.265244.p6 type:complete len:213 gc:universal NODE_279_length_11907_cov_0.265244:4592-5230(+)